MVYRVPASVASIERRMWAKVDKTGPCWVFMGARTEWGYGHLATGRSSNVTHRIVWELNFGPIPDGLLVLHTCDNPPCVKPTHLWLGTDLDNARDKVRKGRTQDQRGEAHHLARLTDEQVLRIRANAERLTSTQWAALTGVTRDHIRKVQSAKGWGHLPGAMPEPFRLPVPTECPSGHPLSGDNLYVHPTHGQRVCRICNHNRRQRKEIAS